MVLKALTLKEKAVDVRGLGIFSREEVRRRMAESVSRAGEKTAGEKRPDSMAKL